jgi:hypothetical protein
MPAHKKTISKMAKSASKKNTAVITNLSDDSIIARIDANLGSYFRLTYHDNTKTIQILGSPRGLFKQRKAQIRFSANDFVVLSGIPSASSEISEIIALLSKKDAHDLYKDGRIHSSIYTTGQKEGVSPEDDFFDYTEATTGEAADAEVDIDNI